MPLPESHALACEDFARDTIEYMAAARRAGLTLVEGGR